MPTRLTATLLILFAIVLPFDARVTLAGPATHVGVSVWPDDSGTFGTQSFANSMKLLRKEGANEVALVIPYQQSDLASVDLFPRGDTPTDQALIAGIQAAHSAGLRVSLRFYDEVSSGTWRALIQPYNRQLWFQHYGDRLVQLGVLAQAANAEQVGVGTEMVSMTDPYSHSEDTAGWQGMIGRLRQVYSGNVMYAADRTSEAAVLGFWNSVDTIGLTAYYPLAANQWAPSVQDLKSSWAQVQYQNVDRFRPYGKPIVFAEVGYPSYGGNHSTPWGPNYAGGYNEQEQANDYRALFEYWGSGEVISGIDLWAWCIDPSRCNGDMKAYSFQGKLAENEVRSGFSGMSHDTTPTQPTQTAPTATQLSVWWPTEGVHLSGVTPFKAQLSNVPSDSYSMTWSVDSGVANSMSFSEQDSPHYQSWVDVSNWNWQQAGIYTLTFTATDHAGTVLATTNRRVLINH